MQELQSDSGTEEILRKFGIPSLEICGASAQVNCINALGVSTICKIGSTEIQPDDAIAIWLNTPENYPVIQKTRPNLSPAQMQGTRVPQFLTASAIALFGVTAVFDWGKPFEDKLKEGWKVQVCLIKPGHYIALTGMEGDYFIFQDSWAQRPGLTNKGLNEKILKKDLLNNTENWFLAYKK